MRRALPILLAVWLCACSPHPTRQYFDARADYTALVADADAAHQKKQIEGEDWEVALSDLDLVNDLFRRARSALNNGDYSTMRRLLDQIEITEAAVRRKLP